MKDLPNPEELQKKIVAARHKDAPLMRQKSSHSGSGLALNMASELIATTATGGVLGYLLDGWLHTFPLCLIIGLLLGGAAGFIAIKRINDVHIKEIEKNDNEAQEMLDK